MAERVKGRGRFVCRAERRSRRKEKARKNGGGPVKGGPSGALYALVREKEDEQGVSFFAEFSRPSQEKV